MVCLHLPLEGRGSCECPAPPQQGCSRLGIHMLLGVGALYPVHVDPPLTLHLAKTCSIQRAITDTRSLSFLVVEL